AINIRLTTVLKGEANLSQWKSNLIDALEALGICKYIEKSVPEPAGEDAKAKWRKERAAVRQTIREKVDQQVINLLRNNGWDYDEKDPFITYSKILKLIPEVSDSRLVSYVLEFLYKKREDYNTLQAYLEHMIQTRERLKSLKIDFSEKVECILLIKAVENVLPNEVKLWKQEIGKEEMTWSFLMNKLMQEARDEQYRVTNRTLAIRNQPDKPSATQTPATPATTTTTTSTRVRAGDRPKIVCKECKGTMPEGWKHCPNKAKNNCPKHIPGGSDLCYYCNPDKAPAFMKPKIDAWLASKGSATNNLLNNTESGLANPNAKTVTWGNTTHLNIDGTYFTNMTAEDSDYGQGFPKSPYHSF
ncbi:hypothetical protein QBC37DRAFT_381552, partial [Rhypophila decipiens]